MNINPVTACLMALFGIVLLSVVLSHRDASMNRPFCDPSVVICKSDVLQCSETNELILISNDVTPVGLPNNE